MVLVLNLPSIQNMSSVSASQRPSATRVAGLYAWNQMGRKVKKGEKGIRILAPIIGVRRKKNEEAEKDPTKQNTALFSRVPLCLCLRKIIS
jgi:hypothetical protein